MSIVFCLNFHFTGVRRQESGDRSFFEESGDRRQETGVSGRGKRNGRLPVQELELCFLVGT
ncbi:MAG: hypothetical protein F6K24_46020 [Okeania sp. SIO2D1]|nr:hypothetical protein [Okeania sp. SIO2D1]